jgi:hypothetical protein
MNAFERILEGIGAIEVVMVMGFLILVAYSRWSVGRRGKLRSTRSVRNSSPDKRLLMFPRQIEGLRQDAQLLIRKRNPTGWQDRKLRSTAIVN